MIIRIVHTCKNGQCWHEKPVENFFWSISLSQTDENAGKQDLECSGEWQFSSFFYTFEIKEGM